MVKLEHFIRSRTDGVMRTNNQYALRQYFDAAAPFYKKPAQSAKKNTSAKNGTKSAGKNTDAKDGTKKQAAGKSRGKKKTEKSEAED